MNTFRTYALSSAIALATLAPSALLITTSTAAYAADAAELNHDSEIALQALIAGHPEAATLAKRARAILIFPKMVKAGLVFGGAFGEGEMRSGSKIDSYYNSVTASWGFQAGVQSYGYVVFLMSPRAVNYVHRTRGWELGVGPTVVVVDKGFAENLSTSTLKHDAYAFIFDQKGLMAGISLEGTKISRIKN